MSNNNARPLDDFSAAADQTGNLVPMVVEQTRQGERAYDLFSRLMKERIILVDGQVTPGMAQVVKAQLLYLDSQDPTKPISMYIDSPGGYVSSGLTIYDTMQYIKAPVQTIVTGQAASMGSIFMVAGAPNMRASLPNASIMIHQPSGGSQGKSTEMQVSQYEIDHIYRRMALIYAAHCFEAKKSPAFEARVAAKAEELVSKNKEFGKDAELTKMYALAEIYGEYLKGDYFMRPEEAKDMGLIDHVLHPNPNVALNKDSGEPLLSPERQRQRARLALASKLSNDHHSANRPDHNGPKFSL